MYTAKVYRMSCFSLQVKGRLFCGQLQVVCCVTVHLSLALCHVMDMCSTVHTLHLYTVLLLSWLHASIYCIAAMFIMLHDCAQLCTHTHTASTVLLLCSSCCMCSTVCHTHTHCIYILYCCYVHHVA